MLEFSRACNWISASLGRAGKQDLHEDTSKIKLHLETNIDVCTIDGRAPPESESTIGNLVKTGALSVGQLLVSHRLLEA